MACILRLGCSSVGDVVPQTAITYPFQPKPPEHAWKEWRILLTSAYMAAARVDMDVELIPLHNRYIVQATEDDQVAQWPPSSRDLSLTDIISYMPPAWKQALGNVVLPEDDGEEIAETLRAGNTIRAWSDGSVANGIGAHAYTLRTNCTGDDRAITGNATTPGHPDTISSLQAEHFGAMAISLIVLAIEWKYSIGDTGFLLLHVDNTEVVNRIKYGVNRHMSADNHAKTDFDIWNETHVINTMINTTVCAKWVRGHQDKHLQEHQGGVGPMPLEAHYNILMDRKAELQRVNSIVTLPTLPMPSDAASLVIGGAFITTKIDEHIRQAQTTGPLREYIKEKNGWSDDIFHLVDWASFGTFMGRLSVSKRAKVVKLQHNWQNTGRQKGLFLRSLGEHEAAVSKETCPMGCGHYEAPLHYLACTRNPKKGEMVRGLTGMKKWMQRNDTAPGMANILIRILRKCIEGKTEDLDSWNFSKERYKVEFEDLIQDQREIGWYGLFQGRLCLK